MNDRHEQNQVRQLPEPGESLVRLDLKKYGLSHLRRKPSRDWTSSEVDKLLDAFAKEDIAPVVEFPSAFRDIDELLHKSYCRRCGKCCLSNPSHPVVEVFEYELELMKKCYHISHRSLRKRTRVARQLRNPVRPSEVATTRWMALPCMFYDARKKQCRVYEVRPLVCKLYPIRLGQNDSSLVINVYCDYGKDIYRSIIAEIANKAQDPVFLTEWGTSG